VERFRAAAREFRESILVPQIMINGFLGFRPRADGFEIYPRLPKDWPKLGITRIHFHRLLLDITASATTITVSGKGRHHEPLFVYLPVGKWQVSYLDSAGKVLEQSSALIAKPDEGIPIRIAEGRTLQLIRE